MRTCYYRSPSKVSPRVLQRLDSFSNTERTDNVL